MKKKYELESRNFTDTQWDNLYRYWEHRTFALCRIVGVVFSAAALIILIPILMNVRWSRYEVYIQVNKTLGMIQTKLHWYKTLIKYDVSTLNVITALYSLHAQTQQGNLCID